MRKRNEREDQPGKRKMKSKEGEERLKCSKRLGGGEEETATYGGRQGMIGWALGGAAPVPFRLIRYESVRRNTRAVGSPVVQSACGGMANEPCAPVKYGVVSGRPRTSPLFEPHY